MPVGGTGIPACGIEYRDREDDPQMQGEHGVTIIEVIMIIAMIGILAVMSIPRIGSFDKSTAYTTARRIIADMRYARRLAITKAGNCIVSFSSGQYTISCAGAIETRNLPDGVTWTGDDEFTFQPLGNASSDGTISIIAGDKQYDVNVIATTGRVF